MIRGRMLSEFRRWGKTLIGDHAPKPKILLHEKNWRLVFRQKVRLPKKRMHGLFCRFPVQDVDQGFMHISGS